MMKLTLALLIELSEMANASYFVNGKLDMSLFLSYLKNNYENVVLPEPEYEKYNFVSRYFDFPFDISLEVPESGDRYYRVESNFDFIENYVPELGIRISPLILESYPSGFI